MRRLVFLLLLAGLLAAPLPAAETAPVAAKPLFRDPVFDGAADPVVIWNPAAQRWWMFYTNRRANAPGLSGVAWVHGCRIGIAESADGGANWKYLGTADLELPPDLGGTEPTHWAPDVITAPQATSNLLGYKRLGSGADDGVNGGHPGVVVNGDRAYVFYFTHPGRSGTISPDDKNSLELRRSSIQVAELVEKDGVLSCDRNAPTRIALIPPLRPVSAK